MMNVDFKLLVFIAAARHLNFTRAAREMHISQPAVSKNICDLEMQAGRDLFVRGRQKLSLSEAGQVLLDHAIRIRSIYEDLNKELEMAKGAIPGKPRMLVSQAAKGLSHRSPE